jgi:drug/metabolite transporter (DMT)-like permease
VSRRGPGPRFGPQLLATAAVVTAAVIFGSTFLVVKGAIDEVDPVTFLAARFCVGALVLLPFAHRRPASPGVLRAGWWCGLALIAGYLLQTIGLRTTSSSVSAFLTYLLVVLVPLLSALVLRRPPGASSWAGVALCTVGLVLLTGGTRSLGGGEALTIGCAVAFAAHVLLLAEHAPRHDALRLNVVQLAVVGLGCLGPGLVLASGRFPLGAWVAAVFCGVAASAVALGLQTYGQAHLSSVQVSLLLLIEPVSAAVLGVATGESLGLAGVAGCAVILGGIVLTVLAPFDRRRSPPLDVAPAGDH